MPFNRRWPLSASRSSVKFYEVAEEVPGVAMVSEASPVDAQPLGLLGAEGSGLSRQHSVARDVRNPLKYAEWIRSLPCCHCGRRPVDAAHVKARGMGGNRDESFDEGNLIPLHRDCHRRQHHYGVKEIENRWGINLKDTAMRLWRQFQESERCGEPTGGSSSEPETPRKPRRRNER